MKIKRSYVSFLNGRQFSEGIRMTSGIILPALLAGTLGSLQHGIVMSVGALCVSTTDAAGPVHHRRNAMLLCNALIFLVALVVSGIAGNSLLLGFILVFFSFIFSMFAVFGARAGSMGIGCLLVMVLNMEHQLEGMNLLMNGICILCGGVWYMGYSLLLYRLRPYKIIQQVLGDVIESTADYLQVRSKLYSRDVNYNEVNMQLMVKQAAVQEKQAIVSELLFKTRAMMRETTNTGRVLVMIFLDVTDLFERLMTSYQQYEVLHNYFDNTEILTQLQQILELLIEELREIGVAVKTGKASVYNDAIFSKIQDASGLYNSFRLTHMNQDNLDGFLALGRIFESIQDLGERIKVLHHYTSYDRKIIRKKENLNYEDFIIRQEINPSLFFDSMSLKSNIFRHSIRVSIAVLIGYIVSLFFHLGHGYWILLTIIVILKPAYSLTKNRNKDRIIGTLLGILIGVAILFFIKNSSLLLAIMILFMTISYIFLRTNYFLSVLLMTPYLLIFFHLIEPLEFRQILMDRLFDTCIGSAIAFLANIFLVPAWEYTSIKMYMLKMLEANEKYFRVIASVYAIDPEKPSAELQVARKEVLIALANLSDAFNRMLSEPKKYQAASGRVHKFVVLNHTLTSHIATLSYYYSSMKEVHTSDNFSVVINETCNLLKMAEGNLNNESLAKEYSENREALRIMNTEADLLMAKRRSEVQQGTYETETKNLLIRIKPVVDQFNYIYSLSGDILKITIGFRL